MEWYRVATKAVAILVIVAVAAAVAVVAVAVAVALAVAVAVAVAVAIVVAVTVVVVAAASLLLLFLLNRELISRKMEISWAINPLFLFSFRFVSCCFSINVYVCNWIPMLS